MNLVVVPWNKGKVNVYSVETREQISESLKGNIPWNKGKTGIYSEDTIRKNSEKHKGKVAWNKGVPFSEDVRKKMSDYRKGKEPWNKGLKGRQSAWNKGIPQTEEAKRKVSISKTGKKQPEYAVKKRANTMRGRPLTDEHKEKIRISHLGNKSHFWKGGISFEPYCIAFNKKLKSEIKKLFDYKCFICGDSEHNISHVIHHVDYNKSQGCQGLMWSLIPLCRSCHAKTNFNRWRWFALLRDYWIYDYIDFDFNWNTR